MSSFKTQYYSLTTPHRIWTTAGQKSYEVAKARIQLLFLSNQYPCGNLTRHRSQENPQGLYTYPACHASSKVETIEHILLVCPAFNSTRDNLIGLCTRLRHPASHALVISFLLSKSFPDLLQLLLDCSTLPQVISSAQLYGDVIYSDLYYVTRNWCFSIHIERMKRLQRWNFSKV